MTLSTGRWRERLISVPLQEFISEHAWGTVWCRDGLDLKSRSLITVAFLVALGRTHELAGHLRGALNNGVSPRELQECLLHAAIYCGVPLAAEAFRCAEGICEQQGAGTEPDRPLAATGKNGHPDFPQRSDGEQVS